MDAIEITPKNLLIEAVDPMLAWMGRNVGVPVSDAARVETMAIAGQESDWKYREQIGGPARSFWQFEKGGGVRGVLTHPASAPRINAVCDALLIDCLEDTVYEAMAWNDYLGAAMARLLLWTDAAALPAVGQQQAAWDYYLRNWRPGKPHPDNWPRVYGIAVELVRNNPIGETA